MLSESLGMVVFCQIGDHTVSIHRQECRAIARRILSVFSLRDECLRQVAQ
jgi:hypothetical protein